MPQLIGILIVGLCFLGAGLQRFFHEDVQRVGRTTLHVDDADAQTLAAYPWVRITHAHLCLAKAHRSCSQGTCSFVVPLISEQSIKDHLKAPPGTAPACSHVAVQLTPAQWRAQPPGTFTPTPMELGGTVLPAEDPAAAALRRALDDPSAVILVQGGLPPRERWSAALMLGGMILMLWGAYGLAWRTRAMRR